ncbi:hypothetical protein B0J11DRAFT_586393 [Dendryphion nanum]|uniref:BTB domain-containing protein n=1 Tax=Dendryphion nanum TaxID=256645 RepID=A0A9P9I7V8_9PLEO|nr:hypothetical protein B0J11DRAFT_586393 [Dendryphion nanum]
MNGIKRLIDDSYEFPVRKKLCHRVGHAPSDMDVVTLIVGGEGEEITAPAKLLQSSSTLFEQTIALPSNGCSLKSTIILTNMHPESVRIYIKWLSHGLLPIRVDQARFSLVWERWIKCYSTAYFLQAMDFQDALMDALPGLMGESGYNPFHLPAYIYSATCIGSPHRKFALDVCLNTWSDMRFKLSSSSSFPSQFLRDLVDAFPSFMSHDPKKKPVELLNSDDPCKYHEHIIEGKPCYKAKRGFSIWETRTHM